MNRKKINIGQLVAGFIIFFSLALIIFQATRSESSVTFYTPAEIYQNHEHFINKTFRVSGLVLQGTRTWNPVNSQLNFEISDLKNHNFFVHYQGLPPDLFKEGQGVVVEGLLNSSWESKTITADLLMVKHSEVYDTKQDHSQMRQAKLLDSILNKEVVK